jgi:hypothetical protein
VFTAAAGTTTWVDAVGTTGVVAGAAWAVPAAPNSSVPDSTVAAPAAASLLVTPRDKPPTSF